MRRPRRQLNHMDWDLGGTEPEKQRTKGAAGGLNLPFLFDSRSSRRVIGCNRHGSGDLFADVLWFRLCEAAER